MEAGYRAVVENRWSVVFSLACGLLVLIVLFTKWRKRPASGKRSGVNHPTGRCSSSSCVRCHGEMEIKSKMAQRLEEYVTDVYGIQQQDIAGFISERYPRVLSTLDSHDRKTEVLRSIYHESGYADALTEHLAHVWMMPGLRRNPLWSPKDHAIVQRLFATFEDVKNFEAIVREFEMVCELEEGWTSNFIPTGSWRTFFLINQGEWSEENASKCPQTVHLLENSGRLLKGSVFGNAMFSVLKPGSRIEPHTSPCNFRLRCHLAIDASTGFYIRVGNSTATWTTGKLFVFDDSFVHTVWHEEQLETARLEDRERVMLIFDIWHPDISVEEQQALNHIFK